MRQRKINLSRGVLFTWGMLFGLIFLFAVPPRTCSRLQLFYASVFRWPLALGRSASLAAHGPVQTPGVSSQEHEELVLELQTKIANLDGQLQDARQKNEQLAKLRDRPGWGNVELRQARVLAMPDATQSHLFISRGSDDGVATGQSVVSLSDSGDAQGNSVIGTVSDVAAKTAKVRLITAAGSQVFASVADLTVRGIMEGQGDGTAKILIWREHKIREDDPVYTGRLPGLDVPVITGRVASCEPDLDNPVFWDVRVVPVCDVATLSDVAIVVSAPRPQ